MRGGDREKRGRTKEEKKGLLVQGVPALGPSDFSVEEESLRPRSRSREGRAFRAEEKAWSKAWTWETASYSGSKNAAGEEQPRRGAMAAALLPGGRGHWGTHACWGTVVSIAKASHRTLRYAHVIDWDVSEELRGARGHTDDGAADSWVPYTEPSSVPH